MGLDNTHMISLWTDPRDSLSGVNYFRTLFKYKPGQKSHDRLRIEIDSARHVRLWELCRNIVSRDDRFQAIPAPPPFIGIDYVRKRTCEALDD